MKMIFGLIFTSLLMAACIEKAPAADLKGAVAINPATGQKVGRVISIGKSGINLDSPSMFGKALYLVPKEQWAKGRCGDCHGN